MTNYYTLTSCQIDNLTQEEALWLESVLQIDGWDDDPENLDRIEWLMDQLFDAGIDTDQWPGCRWEFSKNRDELWISHDERVNIDCVASLVQAFLKHFRPNSWWEFEYAFTAGRPVLGAFGGGCALITAEEIHWMCTYFWLSEKKKELGLEKKGDSK